MTQLVRFLSLSYWWLYSYQTPTARLPYRPTFEPLHLPIFNKTLSSSSSSSSNFDSSSDESVLPTPIDSYGRPCTKYPSMHSQVKVALASDCRRQIRPRMPARESSSGSTSSEAESGACHAVFPQKHAMSRTAFGRRRRVSNNFSAVRKPSAALASFPVPSMSWSDSSSSSSSVQTTPSEEIPWLFPPRSLQLAQSHTVHHPSTTPPFARRGCLATHLRRRYTTCIHYSQFFASS